MPNPITRYKESRDSVVNNFRTLPDLTLTIILVMAGIIFICIGVFSHNLWFKGAAAAYAILP